MKFNVVVGNPPFGLPPNGDAKRVGACEKGSTLYDKFFKLSLELADIVAMILPVTANKGYKNHNNLLKLHANVVEYIDPVLFPNVAKTTPMWYVICDKNNKQKADIKWVISKKYQNNIPWKKGFVSLKTLGYSDTKPKSLDDIIVYQKINNTCGVMVKYARPHHIKSWQLFPKDGYALLLPLNMGDKGWSKTHIVECNSKQTACTEGGMNIVFTKTKEQAQRLVDYMNTEDFIKSALKVRNPFGHKMSLQSLRSIKINDELFSDLTEVNIL